MIDVFKAFAEFEKARAWDYKGVTSQDLAQVQGMTRKELREFFCECKEYNELRARQAFEEERERRRERINWEKIRPHYDLNNASIPDGWRARIKREWEEAEDRERKGE